MAEEKIDKKHPEKFSEWKEYASADSAAGTLSFSRRWSFRFSSAGANP